MRYFMHIITILPHYPYDTQITKYEYIQIFCDNIFSPKFIPINPDFKILSLYL